MPDQNKIVGSTARVWLKRGIVWLTRGQLLNVAAAVHDQPTPLPAWGPGRHLEVRPDDSFIVSYPRSGNTWLRFMVANLKFGRSNIDFSNIEEFVPDIYVSSELQLRSMRGPRILKSHEAFDPRYRRVIYAVRNPRDIIISQFVTLRNLRSDLVEDSFERFVDRQLNGEFDAWFGSWSANVNSWVHQSSKDIQLMIVRYEELQRVPQEIGNKIASFLGLDCTAVAVTEAVENSSRSRLSDLYQNSGAKLAKDVGQTNAGHLQPSGLRGRPTITPELEVRIRQRYGKVMAALGYC